MKNIEEVYKAIQYIEANLKEPISIADAAQSSGYSLFHFSRLFNAAVGHSPYDYIIRRRLSEAAKELMDTNRKITDVAFDYQFNNVETFSRGFKKMFGFLPNKIKSLTDCSNIVFKLPATYEYIEHINGNHFFKPQITNLDALSLIGTIACNIFSDPDKNSITWKQFENELHLIKNLSIAENYFTISFCPISWRQKEIPQLLSVEVNSIKEIPPAFVGKILPSCSCAAFTHEGPLHHIGLTYDYIYQTWLPKSGFIPLTPYTIEKYPRKYTNLHSYSSPQITILVPISTEAGFTSD